MANNNNNNITITEDSFGSAEHPISGETEAVRRFTFKNQQKLTIQVIQFLYVWWCFRFIYYVLISF